MPRHGGLLFCCAQKSHNPGLHLLFPDDFITKISTSRFRHNPYRRSIFRPVVGTLMMR